MSKRVSWVLPTIAFAYILGASPARAADAISCDAVKTACNIQSKAAAQLARDTAETCREACTPGAGREACGLACQTAKNATLAAAAAAEARCRATACIDDERCEKAAKDTRKACDEVARDAEDSCRRACGQDRTCAAGCSATKGVAHAACKAAEAETRATVCEAGETCVKQCSDGEHSCSEPARTGEKICRAACAQSDHACKESCEEIREAAIDACLSTESTCAARCINPAQMHTLAASAGASLSVTSNGTVWTCGDNPGDGTFNDYSTPMQVPGLSSVMSVSGGVGAGDQDNSLALKSDGTVWAWGSNEKGQLGDGTTTPRAAPVQVSGLSGVTAVAGGFTSYSLALKSDGTVWAWGWNIYGQLGKPYGSDQLAPTLINGLAGITAIAAADIHGLALKSDGTVWNWGYNGSGELGIGVVGGADIPPTQVIGLSGVTAVTGGAGFALALKSDGTVWAWGTNTHGSLGIGMPDGPFPTPVQVSGLSGVTAIAAGREFFVLALKSDGTVWAWGNNQYGQLGDGTTTDRNSPAQVMGLSGPSRVIALAAGRSHSLARKSDGTVWAWGANFLGQLGDGTITNNKSTPVQSLLP